jgi:hypothetical protein
MLSTPTQPNTRPKPPAQLRRSQNSALGSKGAQSPPPPPYEISPDVPDDVTPLHRRHLSVCSVSSNVDPSVVATAQMLGLNLEGAGAEDRLLDEEYIRDKSKEELEKLLLKAEAVIRARERGEDTNPARASYLSREQNWALQPLLVNSCWTQTSA